MRYTNLLLTYTYLLTYSTYVMRRNDGVQYKFDAFIPFISADLPIRDIVARERKIEFANFIPV